MRLRIAEVGTLGGKLLAITDEFGSPPKSWNIRYFHNGAELREAMKRGDIENNSNSVIVLPTDDDLVPTSIHPLAVKSNIKLFVVLGKISSHISNRDLDYYILEGR